MKILTVNSQLFIIFIDSLLAIMMVHKLYINVEKIFKCIMINFRIKGFKQNFLQFCETESNGAIHLENWLEFFLDVAFIDFFTGK